MDSTPTPLSQSPHALLLAQRLVALNLHPEQDLHPSWLPAGWPARHRRFGAAGRAVLGDVLRAADAPPPVWSFDDPAERLALVDGPSLRRLAAYCGFAVHRPAFRQRGLARALERQARRYDADAVPFVLDRLPHLDHFAMNLRDLEARPSGAGHLVVDRGHRLLLAALSGTGEVLSGHVRRKLPRRVSSRPLPVLRPAQQAQLIEVILLCIVPERLPQWDWLF
ncbi:hypothetical protein [Rhizobacter sp. Root1221]|uniref:hypothetical protein n=1 Tax=Rhizobacter sp. Root1221 TaxID=1736433 RepID=UPI0006FA8D37|nr:hypothetical protein [Rhizobacter sp. Root1221]KQW02542.1 hypothetical protein ASC87_12520 [Rhizobacter sp. Root1221]